jgi:hypothetical protein
VDRLRSTGVFEPIWVAGPTAVYRRLAASIEVIDTDLDFGGNIRASLETVIRSCPGREIGITTCDILPNPAELDALLEDYFGGGPSDLWFPLIRADGEQSLGASDWKPRYRIAPAEGEPPVAVLPGHLTIFDPASLNLSLLYRLFELAYRSRNRPLRYRRWYVARGMLWTLLREDFANLLALRLPTMTMDLVRSGLTVTNGLRNGKLTRPAMEHAMRRVFVKRGHRIRHPDRAVRMPFLRAMSFARDIDTVEEARAIGATFA